MMKVLLATDASEHSLRAARALHQFVKHQPDVMVTVLHVVPLPEVLTPAAAGGAPLTLPSRLDEYLQSRVQEALDRTLAALDMAPEQVRTKHVIGVPSESILAEVRQEGYDLIVLGRRGLSPLKQFFMGSVSQAVLQGAVCPVFIVP